jgi:hypothetical protein
MLQKKPHNSRIEKDIQPLPQIRFQTATASGQKTYKAVDGVYNTNRMDPEQH